MLGKIVERLRTERGWTQAELALRAGLGQTHISMIENGIVAKVYISTLSNLATAFGMPRHQLVRLVDEAEADAALSAA